MPEALWLVVPAAGQGQRMGADRPKQYLALAGRPVLAHTLERLHRAYPRASLCLCLAPDDPWFDPDWVPFERWQRIAGGSERADSVLNALEVLATRAAADDWVLVHDVARPCVHPDDLQRLLEVLAEEPVGGLLATPVADTMKRADERGRVTATESREGLWHALTPQAFRHGVLRDALHGARERGARVTDEASAIEALGLAPRLVPARRDNLKITHPEDLSLAAHILAAQALESDMMDSGKQEQETT